MVSSKFFFFVAQTCSQLESFTEDVHALAGYLATGIREGRPPCVSLTKLNSMVGAKRGVSKKVLRNPSTTSESDIIQSWKEFGYPMKLPIWSSKYFARPRKVPDIINLDINLDNVRRW